MVLWSEIERLFFVLGSASSEPSILATALSEERGRIVMAELHERPYVQFNFLIDFGAGGRGPHGGFQECSGLGTDLTVVNYDRTTKKPLNVQKLTGINKSTDVILKRGVVVSSALDEWLKQVREGAPIALLHSLFAASITSPCKPGSCWERALSSTWAGPLMLKQPTWQWRN
jgi:phage tail-like protein